MDRRCYFLKVKGLVQGVLFRDSAKRRAQALGLKGYVKNCDDGSVEIIISNGEQSQTMNEFIVWAKKGPLFARIDDIEVKEIPCEEEFQDFSVRS